jgi:hypothetical protein
MASTVCKYCNKVELSFSDAFKSKTGKMIPLDKASGVPHQCPENPYTKQQEQSGSTVSGKIQQTEEQQLVANIASLHKELMDKMTSIQNKLNHISRLIFAITGEQQKDYNLLDNR